MSIVSRIKCDGPCGRVILEEGEGYVQHNDLHFCLRETCQDQLAKVRAEHRVWSAGSTTRYRPDAGGVDKT